MTHPIALSTNTTADEVSTIKNIVGGCDNPDVRKHQIDPPEGSIYLTSTFDSHANADYGKLNGILGVNELAAHVFDYMDVYTLMQFRRLNSGISRLVCSLPALADFVRHSTPILLLLVSAKLLRHFPLYWLADTLRTECCGICHHFGDSVFLPTFSRVCYNCVIQWHAAKNQLGGVLSLAAAQACFALKASQLKGLPVMSTVAGNYLKRQKCVGRYKGGKKLVSADLARSIAIRIHGSERQMEQKVNADVGVKLRAYETRKRKSWPKVPQLDHNLVMADVCHRGQFSAPMPVVRIAESVRSTATYCQTCRDWSSRFDREELEPEQMTFRYVEDGTSKIDAARLCYLRPLKEAFELSKMKDIAYSPEQLVRHQKSCVDRWLEVWPRIRDAEVMMFSCYWNDAYTRGNRTLPVPPH